MIDTKELREKITIKGLDVVADTDILVVLDRLEAWENVFGHLGTPDEVGNEWHALSDRLEAAESEAIEQSRLNGMGAEREAALLAKLEAAEKERDALRAALQHEADCVEAAKAEIEALRAKIAAMEQQEPARLVTPTAYRWRYRGAIKWQYGELTEETARLAKEHNHEVQPLYALPGAHPAPSVPDGWLRAIDEAAESECLEQARLNGMGSEREAALMAKLEAAERERDDLRAKVEQMEKQEPVGKIVAFGESLHEPSWRAGRLPPLMTELYALPGAKGE